MEDRTLRDLQAAQIALQRTSTQFRMGVITDTDPLSVALGGSDTSYVDVKAIAGQTLAVDDVVATLQFGNGVLILGRIAAGGGAQSNGPAGSMSHGTNTLTALTSGPSLTVQEAGTYVVRVEVLGATTGAGLTGLRCGLRVNGTEHGSAGSEQAYLVAQTTNDGGRFGAEWDQTLAKGDVLTVGVASTGAIAASWSGGMITIRPAQ